MFSKLFKTVFLSLVAAVPLEGPVSAPRDLSIRASTGVSYTNAQSFSAYPQAPAFNGPFDPDGAGFYYQGDGNFVVYLGDPSAGNVPWASNTGGNNVCSDPTQCFLTFQSDGNLVIYVAGKAVWSSKTAGKGYLLTLNGQAPYVVVRDKRGNAIYKSSSGTAPPAPEPSCYKGVCP